MKSSALKNELEQILQHVQPQTLLCLMSEDDRDTQLVSQVVAQVKRKIEITWLAVNENFTLQDLPQSRFDLAFIGHVAPRLPKQVMSHLLSALRDVHCNRFALMVQLDDPAAASSRPVWQHHDFLAFGLHKVDDFVLQADAPPTRLYQYDIYDYKRTPDWLNNRHWANPERWDKARW